MAPELRKAVAEQLRLERLTHVQERCIPHAFRGRDLIVTAKTGSGKTLAFLLPALQLLHRIRFEHAQGTGVIVLAPTRELAQQTHDVAQKLVTHLSRTVGLLIGGAHRKSEALRLGRGVGLLVATPGRLLDHLMNTSGFVHHNLQMLVLDEADQMLRAGFAEELDAILRLLPVQRQTLLFSATQTREVEQLARLALKAPVLLSIDEPAPIARLQQGFIVCAAEARFRLLYTFLRRNIGLKLMVFFSSCDSVRFHADLLGFVDLPVLALHGRQKQQRRLNTYYEFCNAPAGALLCTDVAARGLDIPRVDWIVQYDPPDEVREYIHRVGRTCRGAHAGGKALLVLLPRERGYLTHLRQAGTELHEYEVAEQSLAPVQAQLEELIEGNHFLNQEARDAFKSYLRAYASHSLKDVFDVNQLDLNLVACSFGLTTPPQVSLDVSLRRRRRQNRVLPAAHGRQFSR